LGPAVTNLRGVAHFLLTPACCLPIRLRHRGAGADRPGRSARPRLR